MFCTACAAPNPVAAPRCAGCGRPFARARAAVGSVPAPPAPPTSPGPPAHRAPIDAGRRSRRVTAMLVVVPLLALLLVGGAYRRAAEADRAASYERATVALAAGRYDEALAAFAAADGHRDSPRRRADIAADLAPHRAAYVAGVAALDAGRWVEAIAALRPVARDLPAFADAAARLEDARRLLAADLLRQADGAEGRRDWLAAEGALAAAAAADPGDDVLPDRLAALRRAHAPIAIARDGALYLVGPDEADERLIADAPAVQGPLWGPDRSRIAFLSPNLDDPRGGFDLYVVGLDGAPPARVGRAVHPNALPAWSPDGAHIAYTSVAAYDLDRETGRLAVHIAEVATGRETDLTGRTGRHAITPSWSPGGDRIAFVSRPVRDNQPPTAGPAEVEVVELASGRIDRVGRGRVPGVSRVLWSPGSEQILVYTRGQGGTSSATVDAAHYDLLHARTGALVAATGAATDLALGWSPAWSPDGTRFAFVEGRSTVVVQPVGGAARRYAVDPALAGGVAWSPDGLALLAFGLDGEAPSVLVPLDGAPPTAVLLRYDGDWPTWSPVNPVDPPIAPSVGGTARDAAR